MKTDAARSSETSELIVHAVRTQDHNFFHQCLSTLQVQVSLFAERSCMVQFMAVYYVQSVITTQMYAFAFV